MRCRQFLRKDGLRHATIISVVVTAAMGIVIDSAIAGELKIYKEVPSAEDMATVLFGRKIGGGDEGSGFRWKTIRMKPAAAVRQSPQPEEPGVIGFQVYFEFDSDRIHPDDHRFLDEVGRMMQLSEMRNRILVVEGHTDASGEEDYNNSLSRRRAMSVIAYLSSRHETAPDRFIPVGRGEDELLDGDDPLSGVNRRVQFYLPGAK